MTNFYVTLCWSVLATNLVSTEPVKGWHTNGELGGAHIEIDMQLVKETYFVSSNTFSSLQNAPSNWVRSNMLESVRVGTNITFSTNVAPPPPNNAVKILRRSQ
jgi:hypothetical protein